MEAHPHHQAAREWFDALENEDTTEFCRMTQNSFLRLLTTRLTANYEPLKNNEAVRHYLKLQTDFAVRFVAEPQGMEDIWLKWSAGREVAPKIWMDAYLAAFAFTGKMRLVTFEAGLTKYQSKGLDVLLL